MHRWLLLICLAVFVNTLPHEQLFIKSRGFKHLRHAEKLQHADSDNCTKCDTVPKATLCDSEECLNIAKYITKSMDESVDPCNNFYEFACGKWAENNPIPPHMAYWTLWTVIKQNINTQLKGILESDIKKDDLAPVKFAKKWYRSCMDEETIEDLGLEPVESALQRAGGWPITMEANEWDEENYPWHIVEKHYWRSAGIMSIFDLGSSIRTFLDMKQHDVSLSKPSLPLTEDLPKNVDRKILYEGNYYENLIVAAAMDLIELRRATVTRETVVKDAKDIIDFEKKLYRIITGKRDDEELLGEKRMYEWRGNKYGKIWWREKRKDSDDDDDSDGSGQGSGDGENNYSDDDGSDDDYDTQEMEEDEDVISPAEVFIKQLQKQVMSILKGFFKEKTDDVDSYMKSLSISSGYVVSLVHLLVNTPTRTIVNYIHWNFVSRLVKHTTNNMRELQFEVLRRYEGLKTQPPRWETCVTGIKMTDILSYVFVRKYFTDDVKKVATEMITAVQDQIKTQITECDWMDDETKELAMEKIKNMEAFVGYPDWYNNVTAITNYYNGLTVGRQYMDNVLSYEKFSSMQQLNTNFVEQKMNSMWLIDPLTINAIYNTIVNKFVIPAADYQQPFFALAQPDYINFGIVGLILAHEMSHGYDPMGRYFDKNGNFVKWSNEVEMEYLKRQTCFFKQFDNYTFDVPGTNQTFKVDGKKTIQENVADSSGVVTQYNAYKHWMKEKHKPHVTLPGLEKFTEDQLFFLAFANMWCESTTPEYIKLRTRMDVHTTRSLRVIGTLSNSEDFARAYQCPPDSPMNPTEKCNIWK